MNIREAVPTDIQDIYKIHTAAVREGCRPYYTPQQIEAWLQNKKPEGYLEAIGKKEMFVISNEGLLLGFGHAIPGEIIGIFVDPKNHKRGVGSSLLKHALKESDHEERDVIVEATLNAEGFYKKYGFEKIKTTSVTRNRHKMRVILMKHFI